MVSLVGWCCRPWRLAAIGFVAAGVLAQTVTTQAQAVAFIDNFKLMMFVCFLAIPLVLLVQRPR